jgi:hypothetical protein
LVGGFRKYVESTEAAGSYDVLVCDVKTARYGAVIIDKRRIATKRYTERTDIGSRIYGHEELIRRICTRVAVLELYTARSA